MTEPRILPEPLVAQPSLKHPYDRVDSVRLAGNDVQHWSTGSYGRQPEGYIATHANAQAGIGLGSSADTLILSVNTPSAPKGSGLIGGARRLDIALSPADAERLAYILLRAARGAK